jgi:hypothetical protein
MTRLFLFVWQVVVPAILIGAMFGIALGLLGEAA